jgi:ribosomal protein S18 acetylase RimI-like enzyme
MIRRAHARDLDAIVALENASFRGDRITRRSFRHQLAGTGGTILVDVERGRVRGYVLLFLRAASTVARLYSIAVDAGARGRGIGRRLLVGAEREAIRRGRAVMRLEVRKDNAASFALFRTAGYREFAEKDDYYEDGMSALRFEKVLRRAVRARGRGTTSGRKAA